MADSLSSSDWKKFLKGHTDVSAADVTRELEAFEAAEKKDDLDGQLDALANLVSKANKARAAHAKNKEAAAELDGIAREAAKRRKTVEAEAEAKKKADGGDDEDEGGLLADPTVYGAYLKRALGKARTRPLGFAFAVGGAPGQHRMLLSGSKKGAALRGTLKQALTPKALAFGTCAAHAERPDTLVLALESPKVSGLARHTQKLFLAFKCHVFSKVVLFVDGAEVEDEVDPDDASDTDGSEPSAVPIAGPDAGATPTIDLSAWTAARETVLRDLRAVAAKVVATGDPDARDVVIELGAIIRNLTAAPSTPQQITELERYLRTDEIVESAEEVPPAFGKLVIREPLLAALAGLPH